jgi:DNA-binding transcriptional regulator YdaS (Cro superfamily)
MAKDSAHTRTLKRAVHIAGGTDKLAELLGVSSKSLAIWLAGDEPLPTDKYLLALDLVSQGPHHKPPPRRK